MKTKIFTIILFSFIGFTSFCQQIANGDFENWTNQVLFEDPTGFASTNLQSYFTIGESNVLKSTDSQNGTYAAHLITKPTGSGPITGGIFIGTPGSGGISGGTPYSDKPIALMGYYKYNIMPNDTASIMVFLKRQGNIMAVAWITPTGTQLSYTQFTAPFFWLDTVSTHFPDSMVAIFSSSNFNDPYAGSEMFVDNLTFFGASQPFPNGDLENWIPTAYEEADNWTSLNLWGFMLGSLSVSKTTDHYGTGSYALKLESIVVPNDVGTTDTMGVVTNGRLGPGGPEGGMKINSNPKKVSGYYKYLPVGPDTALAALFLYSNNMIIDTAFIQLLPTSSYTYFEMNMNYTGPSIPDTLNIIFSSSNTMDTTNYVGAGSALYLDQLAIEYYPTSINNLSEQSSGFYPNPATDFVYFKIGTADNSAMVTISDIKGAIVLSRDIRTNTFFDVSSFDNGIYFYQIRSENKTETGKLIICK